MKEDEHKTPGIWVEVHQQIEKQGILLFLRRVVERICCEIWNRALARRLGIRHVNILQGSYIRGIENFQIGENFSAGKGFWLEARDKYQGQYFSPKIVIGENVSISFWSHITAIESVRIGNNVMIGSKVLIIDHNHGCYGPDFHDAPDSPPYLRDLISGPVVIGDNVWIGDGVIVMPNAIIGSGCVIGANAVVRGLIPPNTIAVGSPARPVKMFDSSSKRWVPVREESISPVRTHAEINCRNRSNL